MRAANRQRQLIRNNTHWNGKTSKSFFQRVPNKLSDNTIRHLEPIPGDLPRSVHDKVDILADAWTSILQQLSTEHTSVADVEAWAKTRERPTQTQMAVVGEITEADLRDAFRRCQPGKAASPDRLGNSWYKEHEDLLIPAFTHLFNVWYDKGYFPPPFLEADI